MEKESAERGLCYAIREVLGGKLPIICCIGTDAVIGDSLGPLCGTMLTRRLTGKTYVFGTLNKPITASDVKSLAVFLENVYPDVPVLAIDAALGEKSEVGKIKVSDSAVKPGLGVRKNLSAIGSSSIIAIVGDKNCGASIKGVRLSVIYDAAQMITDAVCRFFDMTEDEAQSAIGRAPDLLRYGSR